jgi:hypothetical protein
MVGKPTPAQQAILDGMKQGHVLSRTIDTKYVPFNMNLEHSGDLRSPHVHHVFSTRTIRLSTIKSMEAKGLIAEESRYMSSSGTWGEHETETWCIHYKVVEQKPPFFAKGAQVVRLGESYDIGVTLDDTWVRHDGNGYYNRVRWSGSSYVSTVRADRLKQTESEARNGR